MTQALPAEVAETLDALLSADDAVHQALRDQLSHLAVQERCSCGCGTIYFAIDTDAVAPVPGQTGTVIVASVQLTTDTGENPGEILLFTQSGYLSWLEVCYWTDEVLTLKDARHWLPR